MAINNYVEVHPVPRKKAPPVKNDAPKMTGQRSRNADGQLRRKRGDTHVGTLEKQYGTDFGVRSDMHLDTLLKKEGADSLSDLLDK